NPRRLDRETDADAPRAARTRTPRPRAADRAAGRGACARALDLGSGRADQSYSALCASRPRTDPAHAPRRLGIAVAIANRHAGDKGGGFSARGDRGPRPGAAVQPVPPRRIFTLSLRGDPSGDPDRRHRAAVIDLSAAAACGAGLRVDRRVLSGAGEYNPRFA